MGGTQLSLVSSKSEILGSGILQTPYPEGRGKFLDEASVIFLGSRFSMVFWISPLWRLSYWFWGAIPKKHRLGNLQKTYIYYSQFWRLQRLSWRCQLSCLLVRVPFLFIAIESSHGGKTRDPSETSFIKNTNPIYKHVPKAPFTNTIT